MDITNFISDLSELLDNREYHLWFGTRESYNSLRNINDKDFILEPFQVYPTRESNCKYETNLTFHLAYRRHLKSQDEIQDGGQVTSIVQTLIDDATALLNDMNNSNFIMIRQKLETIPMRYYEANSGQTSNHQSLLRITNIPVTIFKTS